MSRLENIYKLHQLLRTSHYPVSRRKIEDALGINQQTVKRIIDDMRNFLYAPLEYDAVKNGWYYNLQKGQQYELPGMWFNAHELQALLIINKFLQDMQPGLFAEELTPIQQYIEKLLQSQQLGKPELLNRICLLTSQKRKHIQSFQIIANALLQRQQLSIHYHARQDDEHTQRTISPQRLVYYRDNWYLDAWCHLRQQLRNFALDRIAQSKLLNQNAHELDQTILKNHYQQAYGIFAGTPDKTATLHFTPKAARWVAEETWHPKQQGEFLANGHYQLQIPYANDTELIMDILRYGFDVEVISPIELRTAVKEKLRQALAQYEKA